MKTGTVFAGCRVESLVVGLFQRDQPQRDGALQRQIGGAVHDAHAAAADQLLYTVARELEPVPRITLMARPRSATSRTEWPSPGVPALPAAVPS
jgi:hypothetical protein